jgi:hypothetical protein
VRTLVVRPAGGSGGGGGGPARALVVRSAGGGGGRGGGGGDGGGGGGDGLERTCWHGADLVSGGGGHCTGPMRTGAIRSDGGGGGGGGHDGAGRTEDDWDVDVGGVEGGSIDLVGRVNGCDKSVCSLSRDGGGGMRAVLE